MNYNFTRDPYALESMYMDLEANRDYAAALRFADIAHAGQGRKESGELYIHHPIRVAWNLWIYMNRNHKAFAEGSAAIVIPAAILHDVKEDCPQIPKNAIRETFDWEIDSYVDELTNRYTATACPDMRRDQRKTLEALRIRNIGYEPLAIKMLDRLDNLHDSGDIQKPEWKRYVRESRELLSWMPKTHKPLRYALDRILKELERKR